jgi:uncharacterized protein (TIGR02996 family)
VSDTPFDLPEYAALIAAVRADPEDDTLRLAVADWLDERGECERAEFVRVQVEVGRVNPAQHAVRCNCKGCQLRRREDDLLTRLADHFRPAVPWSWAVGRHLRSRCDTPQSAVRRGFVEAVTCPADVWLAHGDAIYCREPVTAVTFSTDPYAGTPAEVRETLDGEQHFRLRGRGDWHPVGACRDAGGGFILLGLYALAWEGVRFTLPAARYEPPPVYTDGPERRGRVVTLPPDFLTRDYTSEAMAAAREAGRRAGERRARMDLARMMQWFGLPDADSGGTSPVTM